MLEKFIIHLKNVIFLKLIVYCLIIGLLLWLIPMLKNDYNISIKRKGKAEKASSEAAVKLYSIIESDSKILGADRMYEEILNSPERQVCNQRELIINKVKSLSNEFNVGPIEVKFSQIFTGDAQNKLNQVRIKNYNVKTKFNAPDFVTLIKVIKQIYNIMPENSIVTLSQIENIAFLDPQIIAKLSPQKQPNLIEAEFNVRIRELSNT